MLSFDGGPLQGGNWSVRAAIPREVVVAFAAFPRPSRFLIMTLITAALLSVEFLSAQEPVGPTSPLSTDAALDLFKLASPELKIEVAAAEPEVVDPVAIAFGADGSMWVVEMRDYPFGPKPGTDEKPKSRIKRLFDHNHDGRFETGTVFADELLFATGILPWKDGVIVTMSGEIAFLADRDDDGRADFKETWFRGFSEENSQLRANHPTLGPDGYVYVANGLRGGTIVAAKSEWIGKGHPVPLAGFDFRFHPLTGDYGAVAGHAQFGLCFDDFGNRFICSNRNPVQHVVLEDHFTRRNPFFPIKTTIQDVSAFVEQSRLYPISQTWTASTPHIFPFTAACGITIFRGDGLPPENKGNAFICEPTGNLVHRETLVSSGATFTSHPSDAHKEFLASSDTWFRPVNLANGPDGFLYVVDMYRAVIEPPDLMSPEMKSRNDLQDGNDRGRIWRIKSDESIMPQERPDGPLDKMSIPALVQLLDHRNSWHRETAFRLLLERHREHVLDALKVNWKQNRLTRSRLPVLWMIHLLDPRLTPAVLAWSEIDNRDPRVREQVIAMIGENLDELLPDDIGDVVAEEADEKVRFRLALDLSGRSADSARERKALVRLIDRGVEDPWLQVAICTMTCDPPQSLVYDTLDHWATSKVAPVGAAELLEQLCRILGFQSDPQNVSAILMKIATFRPAKWGAAGFEVSAAGIRGLGAGIARRGFNLGTLLRDASDNERQMFRELMQAERKIAQDTSASITRRQAAIRSLAAADTPDVGSTLLGLALSRQEIPIRLAALDALALTADPQVGHQLISQFNSQSLRIRRAILDFLLAQEPLTNLLVAALEKNEIKPSEIDAYRQARLTRNRSKHLAARAEKLFGMVISPDRAAVIAKYQAAIDIKGDSNRGRAVFEQNCVSCHRAANMGINVGPDVSDTRGKQPLYLLMNILDPNHTVDSNYFGFNVVTRQGKSLKGLIKAETSTSLTIRMPDGEEETLLRSDIEDMASTGQSLMPVGLEKNITVEQMSDLIAFLKSWRQVDEARSVPQ